MSDVGTAAWAATLSLGKILGLTAAAVTAFGVMIGLVVGAVKLLERPGWRPKVTLVLLGVCAVWMILFVGTLFGGTPR